MLFFQKFRSGLAIVFFCVAMPGHATPSCKDLVASSQEQETFLREASDLAKNGKASDALRVLAVVLERNAGEVRAIGLVAQILADKGQVETALVIVENGLAIAPRNETLRQQKRELLGRRSKIGGSPERPQEAPQGKFKEKSAERLARPVENEKLREVKLLCQRAKSMIAERRFEEALHYLDSALTIDPNDPITLSMKAHVLFKLRSYEEMIPLLDRSLVAEPANAFNLSIKAKALICLGRYEEALAVLQSALAIDGSDYVLLSMTAKLLRLLNRVQEAIGYVDRAIQAAPAEDIIPLNIKADLLMQSGRFADAFKILASISRPDLVTVWLLARAYTVMGRFPAARAILLRIYHSGERLSRAQTEMLATALLAVAGKEDPDLFEIKQKFSPPKWEELVEKAKSFDWRRDAHPFFRSMFNH